MITSIMPGWLALQRSARRMRTTFLESTLAQAAWDRARKAAVRWGWLGGVLGFMAALVAFAPAAWLAAWLGMASGERLVLADARGTLWNGSALPVLTGGAGSHDAAALPGRLRWRVQLQGAALHVELQQDCCIQGSLRLLVSPGLGRMQVAMLPTEGATLRWPAAWLAGLGTPWNTLALQGDIAVASPGFTLQLVQGRAQVQGRLEITLQDMASRVSTLDNLGSYQLVVQPDQAQAHATRLELQTLDGQLLLTGSGQWSGGKLQFRGEARAAEGAEAALNNLLNIIGRRQGASSVISIG